MFRSSNLLYGFIGAVCCSGQVLATDAPGAEQLVLAKALPQATITLQQGMKASGPQSQPISAKYEMHEGHLQLSVYTAIDGEFWEVVVDHETGKISSTEAIAGGEDLAAAKSQFAAMAGAKSTLAAAVDKAEHDSVGYRAVNVMPMMHQHHPTASVLLAKGMAFKTVMEPLD